MSDTSKLGLPEAAQRLGVPVRVLRRAIRAGTIPTPAHLTATAPLSAEWFESAQAAVEASPKVFSSTVRQKVPAFARYRGTSVWRQFSSRLRDYAAFRAAAK